MNTPIIIALSALLTLVGVALTRARDMFAVVVLLSVYSALLALLFAALEAVDVAFTEAVVGTGVSTVFLVALLRRVDPKKVIYRERPEKLLACVVCLALAAALYFGVSALPDFGSVNQDTPAAAPGGRPVADYYITHSYEQMHTPNVVTAVLADYRSFDTLIESAVVLTAALACLLVSRRTP